MRVMHLGAGNLFGGVETFLITLAKLRHLTPEMEPEFALCFRGRLWDELTAAGVPTFDLGAVRVSRPWTVLRARRSLQRLLTERKPDVVVTHGGWAHTVFAVEVRRGGAGLAFYAHNPPERRSLFDRWAALTRPDVVVANSRFTAGAVPCLFPGVPVSVTAYPVLLDRPAGGEARAALRAEWGVQVSDVVILTACRLERWKGHTLLLDALALLREEPGWLSWVAGGAQRQHELVYLNELKRVANRAGIGGRVRFLGQRADVPRLLAAADVHCQPNTGPEPFGIAFVEALAAGLPVVTTAHGGAVEIVDDGCGVLTPPGDAGALAAALRGLIADPDRRRRLGAAGPARARDLCGPAETLTHLRIVLGGLVR